MIDQNRELLYQEDYDAFNLSAQLLGGSSNCPWFISLRTTSGSSTNSSIINLRSHDLNILKTQLLDALAVVEAAIEKTGEASIHPIKETKCLTL